MTNIMKKARVVAVAVVSLTLVLSAQEGQAQGSDAIIVIVNPGNGVTSISMTDLKLIFTKKKIAWDDGTPIVPLNLAAKSPERTAFDQAVLGMNATQVESFWVDQKMRGQAGAPSEVPSTVLLQRVVGQTKGAIAYVRGHQFASVAKVVAVDGAKAGDPGYPLK